MARKKRSTRRNGSQPLYAAKHGESVCRAKKLCVECGRKLAGRRTRWCSDKCVTAYQIRAWPGEARKQVKKRDRGICRDCGLDCLALEKLTKSAVREARSRWWKDNGYEGAAVKPFPEVRRRSISTHNREFVEGYARPAIEAILAEHNMGAWWWRKSFWDADHLLEVSRGGGECGLANLATRCVACHGARTSEQATARAARRRKGRARRISRRPGEYCKSVSIGGCSGRDLPCRGCRRYRARALGSV